MYFIRKFIKNKYKINILKNELKEKSLKKQG